MKTKQYWKSGTRLDTFMNVLTLVLALGALGIAAWDFGVVVHYADAALAQRA